MKIRCAKYDNRFNTCDHTFETLKTMGEVEKCPKCKTAFKIQTKHIVPELEKAVAATCLWSANGD